MFIPTYLGTINEWIIMSLNFNRIIIKIDIIIYQKVFSYKSGQVQTLIGTWNHQLVMKVRTSDYCSKIIVLCQDAYR